MNHLQAQTAGFEYKTWAEAVGLQLALEAEGSVCGWGQKQAAICFLYSLLSKTEVE